MCGRKYDSDVAAIERQYHLGRDNSNPFKNLFDSRPTQFGPILRMDKEHGIELDYYRWGLVPAWWKKPLKELGSTFNATIERIREKKGMWWTPFLRRRCLVPVFGFYEWQTQPDGSKVRHYIKLRDSEVMTLAGLWDEWKDPEGKALGSYTIVTCPANPLMAKVHNDPKRSEGPRMPVILAGETARAWFDPAVGMTPEERLNLAQPFAQETMLAYPVASKADTAEEQTRPIGDVVIA